MQKLLCNQIFCIILLYYVLRSVHQMYYETNACSRKIVTVLAVWNWGLGGWAIIKRVGDRMHEICYILKSLNTANHIKIHLKTMMAVLTAGKVLCPVVSTGILELLFLVFSKDLKQPIIKSITYT